MTDTFDPARHRFADASYFEDLRLGQQFYIPARTVTEAHFSAFQAVSGDNHPIHYDREYCRAQGHDDLLAHGLQVLSHTAAGAGIFPHVIGESLIGFVEVSARFLKGVYAGDTLYPMLEIVDLKAQRTTGVATLRATIHNQRRELVLDGTHKYLLRKRNPSA
ncbi:MAG TPA: MaoC family dehydratase [Candidatus Cybelea sp.]|nr:MaoC family dehydratase [Candidatus Cybelea sp.]